jgi:hypothetical protein
MVSVVQSLARKLYFCRRVIETGMYNHDNVTETDRFRLKRFDD